MNRTFIFSCFVSITVFVLAIQMQVHYFSADSHNICHSDKLVVTALKIHSRELTISILLDCKSLYNFTFS